MTVKELIKLLKQCNPESNVEIDTPEDFVEVKSVSVLGIFTSDPSVIPAVIINEIF